jgi:hypothetical protein
MDDLKIMNVIEKAVALRVAVLAFDDAMSDPDRPLRVCISNRIEQIPAIIAEHCKGLRIAWNTVDNADRGEYWENYVLSLLSLLSMYAEDIAEDKATPAEARTSFRLHIESLGQSGPV